MYVYIKIDSEWSHGIHTQLLRVYLKLYQTKKRRDE